MAEKDERSTPPGEGPPVAGSTGMRLGPLEVHVPRAIGYFGAIALAVPFEVIEAPVGLFIAAVLIFKLSETSGGVRHAGRLPRSPPRRSAFCSFPSCSRH